MAAHERVQREVVHLVGLNHHELIAEALTITWLGYAVRVICGCPEHRTEPIGGSRHQQMIVDEIQFMSSLVPEQLS